MSLLAETRVQTADGDGIRIGELVDRPTILVLPRYYGCLPCRDYLTQVSVRLDEVHSRGASAIAVSPGADFQARWLMEEQGIRFPLLVDRERRVFDALELPRSWRVAVNPKGWGNYARAIARGSRQGRIMEPFQLPGLALLDANAEVTWIHRGRALGDYPKLDRVLSMLAQLSVATPAR